MDRDRGKRLEIINALRSLPTAVPRNGNTEDFEDGQKQASSASPLNFDAFQRRVKTFCSGMWFAKPAEISALQCAASGWCNVGRDELRCEACLANLSCCTLPPVWDHKQYKEAMAVFAVSLRDAHQQACIWKDTSCPDSFLQLSRSSPKGGLEQLQSRVAGLVQVADSLPAIEDGVVLGEKGITVEQCQAVVKWLKLDFCVSADDNSNDQHTSAILLALTGWSSPKSSETPGMLSCQRCFRSCGSWNFQCVTSVETTVAESDSRTVSAVQIPLPSGSDTQSLDSQTVSAVHIPLSSGSDTQSLDSHLAGESPDENGSSDITEDAADRPAGVVCVGGVCSVQDQATLPEPAAKRPRPSGSSNLLKFHPIDQHRAWCPWIQSVVSDGGTPASSPVPAWQGQCLALLNEPTTHQSVPGTASSAAMTGTATETSPAKTIADIHSLLKSFKPAAAAATPNA